MNLSLRRFIIDVFPMTTLLILLTALKFLRCRKGCKSHNLLIYTLYCGERGKCTIALYLVVSQMSI